MYLINAKATVKVSCKNDGNTFAESALGQVKSIVICAVRRCVLQYAENHIVQRIGRWRMSEERKKVVERFKADGPGWQTRMDEALKKAAGL